MKTLKELYQLITPRMLDNMQKKLIFGICYAMLYLFKDGKIDREEYVILSSNFRSRKPKYKRKNGFWFSKDLKGNEQRKQFIKQIIESL